MTQNIYRIGGNIIVVLDINGGAAGGALSDEVITLRPSSKQRYLYNIEGIPGAGAAEPAAHNILIKDSGGVTIVASSAGPTTANIEIEVLGSRENYWAMTGNLTISVDDVGAANTVQYRLLFV